MKAHVYPRIGHKPIEALARRDVHAIADALLAEEKVALAHRVVRIIKAILNWCVERGELQANPAARLKLARVPQSRDRVLSDAELREIWAAAGTLGEPHASFVKVLMLSAQRLREIAGAQWAELRNGMLVIPAERYKSGREHEAVLPAQALASIEALRPEPDAKDPSPFVFAGRGGRPIGDFSKLKERLDAAILAAPRGADPEAEPMPRWTFHDLRRSAASWLHEQGGEPHIIGAVLGHAVEGVLKVYARGHRRELKAAALRQWADWLSAEPEPERASKVVPLRGPR